MRFRGLAIASAVLLALSGVLYWSAHHKTSKKASAASSTPVILSVKPASVNSISIRQMGEEPVTLTRQASGNWQITAPKVLPADQHITMTKAQLNLVRISSQFLLPLIVIFFGVFVWWKRR